jgi:hypothetical protein
MTIWLGSRSTRLRGGRGSVGGCKPGTPVLSHARQQVVGSGFQQGHRARATRAREVRRYFTSTFADSEYVAPVFRSLTITVTV